MTRPLLTYKSSRSGTTFAAYRGAVRVGYVNHSPSARPGSQAPEWTWNLNLLQPEGSQYFGRSGDEKTAKADLLAAFTAWLGHANLKEK